jgi:hypothetical protein
MNVYFLTFHITGGQAKTLMFVQLNPDVSSYSETISTLKFAERVSGVELGAARSSKEGRDVRELMGQVCSGVIYNTILLQIIFLAGTQWIQFCSIKSTNSSLRLKQNGRTHKTVCKLIIPVAA